MLIHPGRVGRGGLASPSVSVIIPALSAAGAALIPMQTLTGASTFPIEFPNPTTGAAVGGDGTVNTTSTSAAVTFGTVATSARFSHTVVSGQRYRISWTESGTSGGQAGFGTSAGGTQYRSTIDSVQGDYFDFTATTTTVWISFQRASAGTTTFQNITIIPIAEPTWTTNAALVVIANWTQLSSGVTVDGTTGAITIPATGSNLSARQQITGVTQGNLYRLSWTNGSNTTQCLIGTANGGSQIKTASSSDPVGARTFEFVAQSQTWIQFQRATTGTAVVSNIVIQEAT